MKSRKSGFTVVELVAVVAIVTVLGTLAVGAYRGVADHGNMARETSALRKLIAAYVGAATENDGVLPAGYDRTARHVEQKNGRVIHGPAAERYPWRMMPYLDRQITQTLYVTNNRAEVDFDDAYMVSLYPSFGINYLFVGGDVQADGEIPFQSDVALRLSQVSKPSSLLVFATSRANGPGEERIQGFNTITPPSFLGSNWSGTKYDPESSPESTGHLDLRHKDRALAAFLDGHVESLDLTALSDIRRWSMNAADLDDPNYRVTRSDGPGTPRGR
jgi:prepilin-type processing-associated H-X9-DG protein